MLSALCSVFFRFRTKKFRYSRLYCGPGGWAVSIGGAANHSTSLVSGSRSKSFATHNPQHQSSAVGDWKLTSLRRQPFRQRIVSKRCGASRGANRPVHSRPLRRRRSTPILTLLHLVLIGWRCQHGILHRGSYIHSLALAHSIRQLGPIPLNGQYSHVAFQAPS